MEMPWGSKLPFLPEYQLQEIQSVLVALELQHPPTAQQDENLQ